MSGPDQLKVTNEILFAAIEAVAVRLNAQEAIVAAVAAKLKITEEEAFAKLDRKDFSETEHWLPKIRRAIIQTLSCHH